MSKFKNLNILYFMIYYQFMIINATPQFYVLLENTTNFMTNNDIITYNNFGQYLQSNSDTQPFSVITLGFWIQPSISSSTFLTIQGRNNTSSNNIVTIQQYGVDGATPTSFNIITTTNTNNPNTFNIVSNSLDFTGWNYFLCSTSYQTSVTISCSYLVNGINAAQSTISFTSIIDQNGILDNIIIGGQPTITTPGEGNSNNNNNPCQCSMTNLILFYNQNIDINNEISLYAYSSGLLRIEVWYLFSNSDRNGYFYDSSGNNRNAKSSSSTLIPDSGKIQSNTILDIQISNTFNFSSRDNPGFSIFFYFKMTELNKKQIIFNRKSTTNSIVLQIGVDASSYSYVILNNNNTMVNVALNQEWISLTLMIWSPPNSSITVVYHKIYSEFTWKNPFSYSDDATDIMKIGPKSTDNYDFTGYLKDFRIFSGFLGHKIDFINDICYGFNPIVILPSTNSTSTETCLSCNTNEMMIIDNNHLSSCLSSSTCPTTSFQATSFACTPCKPDCGSCNSISTSMCTSCSTGLYYYSSLNSCVYNCLDLIPNDLSNTCDQCPIGQGPNPINLLQCSPCSSGCQECRFSSLSCTKCLQTSPFMYNEKCYSTCPDGTYNATNSSCHDCHVSCATCTDKYTTSCIICSASLFPLRYYYQMNNTCLTSCPDSYYPDPISKTCSACYSTCLTCKDNNKTSCLSCYNGYVLIKNYTNEGIKTYCRWINSTTAVIIYNEEDMSNTFDLCYNKSVYAQQTLLKSIFNLTVISIQSDFNIKKKNDSCFTFEIITDFFNQDNLIVSVPNTLFLIDIDGYPISEADQQVTLGYYEMNNYYDTHIEMQVISYILLGIGFALLIGIIPLFFTYNLSAFWNILDTLQILYYFSYLNIDLPKNFICFLSFFKFITIPLPNIPSIIMDLFVDIYNITIPKQVLPRRFAFQGLYGLFLINGSYILLYSFFCLLLLLIIKPLASKLDHITGKYWFTKLAVLIKWNLLLRYIQLTFYHLIFTSLLQFYTFDFDNMIGIISNSITLGAILFIVIFIIWTINLMIIKRHKLSRSSFIQKYGTMIDNLNLDSNSTIHHQFFPIILLLRKLFFMSCIVLLYNDTLTSLHVQNLLSIYMLIWISWTKPFKRKDIYYSKLIFELLILFINFIFLAIDGNSFGENTLLTFGWVLIITIFLFLFYIMIILLKDIITGWKYTYKYARNIYITMKKKPKRMLVQLNFQNMVNEH